MKKNILCKIAKCDNIEPAEVLSMEAAYAGLLVAAKDVFRVAPYKKTLAMVALETSIEKVEEARKCRQTGLGF